MEAHYNLGIRYLEERGTAQNVHAAVREFTIAANASVTVDSRAFSDERMIDIMIKAYAYKELGDLHRDGFGVGKNMKIAMD